MNFDFCCFFSCWIVVGFYFWLVVLSYYRKLKVQAMMEQQETGEKGAEISYMID
jgi:hypothetical protein